MKGLVDSGITEVPGIFRVPVEVKHHEISNAHDIQTQVPIISLEGYQGERRKNIINELLQASRTWGVFQVVNHGIPSTVIENALDSVRKFHEQPKELKEEFYSHDSSRKVWYYTTLHPFLRYAFWKDTIACQFEDVKVDFEALPSICRRPMSEYVRYVIELKDAICKLFSEALGLDSNYLQQMQCMEARKLVGHYYPACPQPNMAMGTPKHSDPYFLTILSQNNIDGLQVLHQNHWIDVPPAEGALTAIIGDMLQLIANDSLKSAEHRVLARRNGPRLSTACFFYPNSINKDRAYGPIKDLLSDNDPALYRETTHAEYLKCFKANGNSVLDTLPLFRK